MTIVATPPSGDTAQRRHRPTAPADAHGSPDRRRPPTRAGLPPPSGDTSPTAWSPTNATAVIALISVVAGLVAAYAGVAPTGDPTVDQVLVGLTVAGVTWLGAAALRWDAALAALLAGLLSMSVVGAVVGALAAVIGFGVRVRPGQRGVVNAVLVGVALNLAARSDLGWFLGASTLVFLLLATYVGLVGFLRRRRATRQVTAIVIGVSVLVAVLGTLAFVAVGALALDDLRDGNDLTRDGLRQLGDGDLDAAQASFAAAADSFDTAHRRIGAPLVSVVRFVPGVAQHHRVADELSEGAAAASARLATELDRLDLEALTVTGGRIDVDQVRALETPLAAIELEIARLQRTVADVDSRWLVPPLATRLDDLADDLVRQRRRSEDALAVAGVAPGLLGADEPRTYFVGFTTPSEARGLGGFMGNWAEVRIDQGRITLTRFGRSEDLNLAGDPATRRFTTTAEDGGDDPATGPDLDEWLARYGRYNLASGPGGTTGPEPWKNINMSPDMAATGRAIADLYPQSGGGQLDGVFVLDVYTLARFLRFTGPIPLPDGQVVDGQTTVDADDAAAFLLHGQYDLTKTQERVDVLEEFSQSVLDTLLAGTLPPPNDLADTLAPMVDQGRFTGWAARSDEQAALAQIGLTGTLPAPTTGDAIAIAFNNLAGNKIDFYLDAAARYEVTADASTGTATAQLELTLTNDAPANGEPNYVIGNLIDLPDGYNRTWVSVFTTLPVTGTRLDGHAVEVEPGAEAGYFVTSVFVPLAPGGSATLTFDLEGVVDVADGYELLARTPPTVAPTPVVVDATWTAPDGERHEARLARRDPGVSTLTVTADR